MESVFLPKRDSCRRDTSAAPLALRMLTDVFFNGNAPLPGRRILLADIRGGRTYFELRLKPLLRCFQIAEVDV